VETRRREIAKIMGRRARRTLRGWILVGLVATAFQLLNKAPFAGLWRWHQVGATLLFFSMLGWAYAVRSAAVAWTGWLGIARIAGAERMFGEEAVPPSAAPVPFNVASGLWGALVRLWGNLLPGRRIPLSVPFRGKDRYADLYLFEDEEVLATPDGEVLCLMAKDLWFYPPSPFVVRVRAGDPDADRWRALVPELIAAIKDGTFVPEHRSEEEVREGRRRTLAMWGAVVATYVGVWWCYLPLLLEAPLLVLPILGILSLAPVVLGLIRWRTG